MADTDKRLDLKLMASAEAWRLYSARKMDPKFKAFEKKVLTRDQHTCQFCGFQANLYQEVVNADGNFANNQLSNLVTACCFCMQCFFIESVGGGGFGGGVLIYLPEIAQRDLNSMCHVLFCAITNNTGYKHSAQTIYRSLKARTKAVEDKYGEGTSDPAILGHLMIDSGHSKDDYANTILADLRLLPSRGQFRKQIEQWAASAIDEMSGT